jgi:GGDEF domain-containing protein
VTNVTKTYENYQYLFNEKERDKLTGLLNRKTFEAKLQRRLGNQSDWYLNFNAERAHTKSSA